MKRGPKVRVVHWSAIVTLAVSGLSMRHLAEAAGLSRSEFYRRLQAEPELKQRIEGARAYGKKVQRGLELIGKLAEAGHADRATAMYFKAFSAR